MTGNLAVVSYNGVAIFPNSSGSPTLYSMNATTLYAGYNNAGDLFVDGYVGSSPILAELPRRRSKFKTISLNESIGGPGEVQWDGKYISIETLHYPIVYQIQVSGSSGTIVGTTDLKEGSKTYVGQSWIQGQQIVAPCEGRAARRPNSICLWEYPSGGSAKEILKHIAHGVSGVTVSLAPK